MKLIVKAGLIPDGARVCKPNGTTEYKLLRQITVYYRGPYVADEFTGDRKQVVSSPDVSYMVGDGGQINAVSNGHELCWIVDEWELLNWLQGREDENESFA